MSKKVVAVLFGGQSSEHDVSKISATTIISAMDQEKYVVLPIYITKDGRWLIYDGPVENINNGNWEKFASSAIISPDTSHRGILRIVGDKVKRIPVDLVFPVLHGAKGEDGTIQGLLEISGLPYVGCGVLSSAVSMNKAYTKIVVEKLGIPQADYTVIYKRELGKKAEKALEKAEKACGYPCFVKPANAGSSVGITKAHDRTELLDGLMTAAEHDTTIVVEKAIEGREVECAVLGNEKPKASPVGEILAADEFYSYDAKYNNKESKTLIPAKLPKTTSEKIRKYSVEIFKALDCKGLSRVDFFVEKGTNKVIFNEINTLPGFTSISMYPMLFAEDGIPLEELIDNIIELGLEGHND